MQWIFLINKVHAVKSPQLSLSVVQYLRNEETTLVILKVLFEYKQFKKRERFQKYIINKFFFNKLHL